MTTPVVLVKSISLLAVVVSLAVQPHAQVIPWPTESSRTKIVDGKLEAWGDNSGETVVLAWIKPQLPSNRFVLRTRVSGHARSYAVLEATLIRRTKSGVETKLTVRSNDTGGPMAKLIGDFRDRVVELPFATDPEAPPDEIKVILQFHDWFEAKGSATFEPFTVEPWLPFGLLWFAAGGFAMIVGVGLGLVGGVYALLVAIPAFRRTAYVAGKALTWLGVLAIAAAGGLYLWSMPCGIWITLGAAGLLSAAGFGLTLPLVRNAVADVDERHQAAGDLLEPGQ